MAKRNSPPRISEATLKKWVTKKLQSEGWLVIRMTSVTPNGVPDLLALKRGKTWFLELKSSDGDMSEIQKIICNKINDAGILVSLIRSKDDLIRRLRFLFGDTPTPVKKEETNLPDPMAKKKAKKKVAKRKATKPKRKPTKKVAPPQADNLPQMNADASTEEE